MSEANKNTIKDLAKMGAAFAVFVIIALYVPDDSIVKQIFSYICLAIVLGGAFIFTPLGNPIRKLFKKKEGKNK